MTGTDWVAATAGDPLQPVLLWALRTTMTPESDAQVDLEANQLGVLMERLDEDEKRRLAYIGAILLSLTPMADQARAMSDSLEMDLPVVWRRGPRTTTRGAFGEQR